MTTMDIDSERRSDDPAHGLGPTRARVLALLQDAGEPLTAAAVGARLALHVNSARFHLDALAKDGLVLRRHEERSAPGRPKVLYGSASVTSGPSHRSYRLLAEILATFLADRLPDPAGSAEEAGRAWGRYFAPPQQPFRRPEEPEALEALVRTLDQVGFDSHVVDEASSLRLEISHCPFLEVAEAHNEVVCSVHLGLMRGMLGEINAPVSVDALEPLVEPSRCIAHMARITRDSRAVSRGR